MVDKTISDLVFAQLQSNDKAANQQCFDCKIALSPSTSWGSVCHGIFLCEKCGSVHQGEFPAPLNNIRSLDKDKWTNEQLKYFTLGGNENLKSFLLEYDLMEIPP